MVNKIFEKKRNTVAFEGDFFRNNFQSFETKSGIQIVDFLVGEGTSPSWGTFVKVNYVSYITDKETIKKMKFLCFNILNSIKHLKHLKLL